MRCAAVFQGTLWTEMLRSQWLLQGTLLHKELTTGLRGGKEVERRTLYIGLPNFLVADWRRR